MVLDAFDTETAWPRPGLGSGHCVGMRRCLLLNHSGHRKADGPNPVPTHRMGLAERKFSHNTMLADLFYVPHLEVPRRF